MVNVFKKWYFWIFLFIQIIANPYSGKTVEVAIGYLMGNILFSLIISYIIIFINWFIKKYIVKVL